MDSVIENAVIYLQSRAEVMPEKIGTPIGVAFLLGFLLAIVYFFTLFRKYRSLFTIFQVIPFFLFPISGIIFGVGIGLGSLNLEWEGVYTSAFEPIATEILEEEGIDLNEKINLAELAKAETVIIKFKEAENSLKEALGSGIYSFLPLVSGLSAKADTFSEDYTLEEIYYLVVKPIKTQINIMKTILILVAFLIPILFHIFAIFLYREKRKDDKLEELREEVREEKIIL